LEDFIFTVYNQIFMNCRRVIHEQWRKFSCVKPVFTRRLFARGAKFFFVRFFFFVQTAKFGKSDAMFPVILTTLGSQ
jgi:hypothetical protein